MQAGRHSWRPHHRVETSPPFSSSSRRPSPRPSFFLGSQHDDDSSSSDSADGLADRPTTPPERVSPLQRRRKANGKAWNCAICMETATSPIVTPCGHLHCWSCIYEWFTVSHKSVCPFCRAPGVSQSTVIPIYLSGTTPDPRTRAVPPRPRPPLTTSHSQPPPTLRRRRSSSITSPLRSGDVAIRSGVPLSWTFGADAALGRGVHMEEVEEMEEYGHDLVTKAFVFLFLLFFLSVFFDFGKSWH